MRDLENNYIYCVYEWGKLDAPCCRWRPAGPVLSKAALSELKRAG